MDFTDLADSITHCAKVLAIGAGAGFVVGVLTGLLLTAVF